MGASTAGCTMGLGLIGMDLKAEDVAEAAASSSAASKGSEFHGAGLIFRN